MSSDPDRPSPLVEPFTADEVVLGPDGQGEPGAVLSVGDIRYDRPWLFSLWRPFLIAVLVACFNLVVLGLMHRFDPSLPRSYGQLLLFAGVSAALLGCTTTSWLSLPDQRQRRTGGYRVAELLLLLVGVRLLVWAVAGSWPAPSEFLVRPLTSLLDGLFVVVAFVTALSWSIATETTRDLIEMALQPDEIRAAASGSGYGSDSERPAFSDRQGLMNGFVARWVVVGVVMVMLTALTQFDRSETGWFALMRQRIAPSVIGAVLVYFLVGLLLISQGQLAILRARWALEHTPSDRGVLRNWPLYVFLLLLVIAVVAALLPFGSTFRLAQLLSILIGTIYLIIFTGMQLLLALFWGLLSLLPLDLAPPPELPPSEPPPVIPTPEPPSEILQWAGGAVFWLMAALLVGYAAFVYFTDKGARFRWLTLFWQLLSARWRTFVGGYRAWRQAQAAERGASAETTGRRRRLWADWFRRELTPEQKIRYYYLSTLEEAAEAGVPRRAAETPYQYAPRLETELAAESELPEQTAELTEGVEELTAAFVGVRYAQEPVDRGRLSHLEQIWERLKRGLQR